MITWFTIEDAVALMDRLKATERIRYFCGQIELSPTSDRLHWQIYIELFRNCRLTAIQKLFPGCHAERRIKTRQNCRAYCSKEETRAHGPFEFGTFTAGGQGKRNDISNLAEYAVNATSLADIIRQDPGTYARYSRGLESIFYNSVPPRTKPPIVEIHYGCTGSGKTLQAFNRYQHLYRKMPAHKWFDRYHGQECCLFDDFAGKFSKTDLTTLLILLDRYPLDVEIKGHVVPFTSTRIIITTNLHPYMWYDYTNREEHYRALARRFTHCVWYPAIGVPPIHCTKDSFFTDWYQGCDEYAIFKERTRPQTPVEEVEEEDSTSGINNPDDQRDLATLLVDLTRG